MAKCVLQLFVFIWIVYVVAANMKTVPPNPNYPNQCFDGKRAYNVGKYYPTHRLCKQMFCRDDSILIYEDCGTVEVPAGYKNVQDLSKRFPDCCVKLVKIVDDQTKIDEDKNKMDEDNSKLVSETQTTLVDGDDKSKS